MIKFILTLVAYMCQKMQRMHDLPLWFFNDGFKFQNYVCNGCHVKC